MAEMYETLQTQTKQDKYLKYILLIVIFLFLAVLCFTIYYVAENPPNDASSSSLCTTAACISLANDILSSINEFGLHLAPCLLASDSQTSSITIYIQISRSLR